MGSSVLAQKISSSCPEQCNSFQLLHFTKGNPFLTLPVDQPINKNLISDLAYCITGKAVSVVTPAVSLTFFSLLSRPHLQMEQQSTVHTQHPLHRTGSCKRSKAASGSDSQGLLSTQVMAAQTKQYPESQLCNKYNCCFTLFSPTQETKD